MSRAGGYFDALLARATGAGLLAEPRIHPTIAPSARGEEPYGEPPAARPGADQWDAVLEPPARAAARAGPPVDETRASAPAAPEARPDVDGARETPPRAPDPAARPVEAARAVPDPGAPAEAPPRPAAPERGEGSAPTPVFQRIAGPADLLAEPPRAPRETPPVATRRREAPPQQAPARDDLERPSVTVRIERVEVRAAAPKPARERRPVEPQRPLMSLENFLAGRSRGER